jgi:hypothetical protein
MIGVVLAASCRSLILSSNATAAGANERAAEVETIFRPIIQPTPG